MIFFLNAINLLTVLVGFIVQILIVRFFGASDSTDIYYLILTIITFVTGISTGFLTDLFVPIYHDAKNRGIESAQKLTGSILTLSLMTGFIITAVVYFFSPMFISFFASGFPASKFSNASAMLRIVSFSITFTTISMVLNSTLNANSFLLVTYLTNLITPLFNAIGLFLFGEKYGIAALMYAMVAASVVNSLILFAYCKLKVGARFSNPFRHSDIPLLLMKNVPVRAANIVQMLRGPLTTSVLSYFPAGMLTLYSYAEKIVSVLVGTTNSPLAQVYYIKSSELASKGNFGEIKKLLVHIVKSSVILFAGTFFLIAIIFQKVFSIIFASKVSADGIHTMFLVLTALFPFYYITLLGTEVGQTGLALKKGRLTFYSTSLFIIILAGMIVPSVKLFSIYGLPLSLFVAQLGATLLYARLINKIEPLIDSQIISEQLSTISIMFLMIIMNFIAVRQTLIQVIADIVLFLIWTATNWKGAISTMRLITAKGEVR
jgi:putative peptidoglycan lipid II flippase